MPGRQPRGFAPRPNLMKGRLDQRVEQPAVCVQILHGPPGSPVLEAQPEVVHLFVGLKVVPDLREAVLHFVSVVPSLGRRHKTLEHVVQILHSADFAVQVQRGGGLPFVLALDGHRGIGRPRDGLVRQLQFKVCLLEHLQQATFGVLGFALHDLGFDGLAGECVLNEDHKRALLRLQARDALAPERHVLNLQRQNLSLVKRPLHTSMSSHVLGLPRRYCPGMRYL